MNILSTVPPIAVVTEFTSLLRPLAPETKGFLWQYGASTGQDDFSSQFQEELLIREGGKEYWASVPSANLQPRLSSLQEGQQATLYVRLLGSLQSEEELKIVFALTDIVP